jgi:replicative DNA helicase
VEKLSQKSLEKLPPFNIEAEQAILSALFLDNEAIHTALQLMDATDFYRPSHYKLFSAFYDLIVKGEAVDLLFLKDELLRRKQLDEVGGPAYLAFLVDQVPTAANIEFHAKIVHEKALARQLLNNSVEIASRCYDAHEEIDDLMEAAEQKQFALSDRRVKKGFRDMQVVVNDSFRWIESMQERPGEVTGIPTALVDLDAMTGGFQPADLVIIAGRPAMGKTSLALGIGEYNASTFQTPGAIFSMEMSDKQLGLRLLCEKAKLDSNKVRTGVLSQDEWHRLASARELLSRIPMYIDETPALKLVDLRSKARKIVMEKGIKWIIVDYLQLMDAGKKENRTQEVSTIARGLKAIAKELDVPVIALSQLSRKVEERADKRPNMGDLRESGDIEAAADTILLIYRPEVYGVQGADGIAELIIGKQRSGPVGTVMTQFSKTITRFENLAHQASYPNEPENPFGRA